MRLFALILLLLLSGPALAQPGGGGPMPPPPVEVTTATRAPLYTSITTIGSLLANESIIIRPEIAGLIKDVMFDEGQPVKSGQSLFTLDQDILSAEAKSARSSAVLGSANLDREQKLKQAGYTTQQALDAARTAAVTNRAASTAAQVRLNKTVVKAPYDGIIGLRKVSLGDYVNIGQDLVNLEQIDPIKLEFTVPEVFLGSLKAGLPVNVLVDAYAGETFSGAVYAVDPKIDPLTRTITARAHIANPDAKLRPGLFARVNLPLTSAVNNIVVPETTLVPEGSKMLVFRIVDGKAERIEVKMGQRNNGKVEVVEGLNDGDTVIVTGQMRVVNGGPVNVVNTIAPAAPAAAVPEPAKTVDVVPTQVPPTPTAKATVVTAPALQEALQDTAKDSPDTVAAPAKPEAVQ